MFHSFLLEDNEFRILNIPLVPEERQQLEKKIHQYKPLPVIHTWRNIVLDNYDVYDLCLKHHRIHPSINMDFQTKHHALAWLCRKQLRREDLTKAAKVWLLYRLYIAEKAIENKVQSKEYFQYRQLSPSTKSDPPVLHSGRYSQVIIRIAKEYNIYADTLARYSAYGKKIDMLESLFPGVRNRILTGKLEIHLSYMNDLLEMPREQLQEMINNPNCHSLIPLCRKKKETPKANKPRKPKIHLETAIKQTPSYDPDSALNGLSYTIAVWKKTITQAQENVGLKAGTKDGKARLRGMLHDISAEIEKLTHQLEENTNERIYEPDRTATQLHTGCSV